MAEPAALRGNNPLTAVSERHPRPPARNLAELQAKVEGVPAGDGITFRGQFYKFAPEQGAIDMLDFAADAVEGLNFEDPQSLAAIRDTLRDLFVVAYACDECDDCRAGNICPHQDLGDWPRFKAALRRQKAGINELVELMMTAISAVTARPTQLPSDSSDGQSKTLPSSTESSPPPDTPTGQVIERMFTPQDLMDGAVG